VERIVEKLSELKKIFKTDDQITYRHAGGYRFKVLVEFDDNSAIFKELSSYEIPSSGVKVIPFVPKNILQSSDKKIIFSFLRGYCDLKSRISLSDGIYKKKKGKGYQITSLRMGISIPNGRPELLELFRELLAKIGVRKGASFYKREDREHLIRIDVRRVPYQLLGTHWKRIFLSDFKKFLAPRTKAIQYMKISE
jgi:hypothetical protein